MEPLIQEQPEASDVAFNTFIGVLVSVCGNVRTLYRQTSTTNLSCSFIGTYISGSECTKESSNYIFVSKSILPLSH